MRIGWTLVACLVAHVAFAQTERKWDGSVNNDYGTNGNWSGNSVPDTTSEGGTIDLSLTPPATSIPAVVNNNPGACRWIKVNTPGYTGLSLPDPRGLTIENGDATPPTSSPTASTNVNGTFAIINGTVIMNHRWAFFRIRGGSFTLKSGDATPTFGLFNMSDGRVDFETSPSSKRCRILSDVPYNFPAEDPTDMTTRGFRTLRIISGATLDLEPSVRIRIWGTDDPATAAIEGLHIQGTFNGGTGTIIETASWKRSGTWVPQTSHVKFTGTIFLNGETFYDLTIKSGTTTLNGAITVLNNLVIEPGATLNCQGNTLTVQGNFTNNGTLNTDGTVIISKATAGATHTIGGSAATTFKTLQLGDGLNSQTHNFTFPATAPVTITSSLNLTAASTLNAGPSYFIIAVGASMSLAGTPNFTGGTNTSSVEWRSTALLATNAGANVSWYNLIVAATTKPGVTGGAATVTVTNDFTIASGGSFNDGSVFSMDVGGNWIVNGGTSNMANTTVRFTKLAASAVILGGGSSSTSQVFNNLVIGDASGDTVSIAAAKQVEVQGTLTITTGCSFNLTSGTLIVSNISYGSYADTSIVHGTSTAVFRGSALPDDEIWYNLTIDGASVGIAADGPDADSISDITVTNNLTINSTRTLNGGSATILVSANWTNNGSFTAGTSTVELTSSTATTIGGSAATTFNILRINKGAASTLVSVETGLTCNGALQAIKGILQLNPGVVITGLAGITIGEPTPADGTTNAMLRMNSSSQAKLGNNTRMKIDYTGKLETSGTAPTITGNADTDVFIFEIFGRINTAGLNIVRANYDDPATTVDAYGVSGTGSAVEGGLFIRVNPSITVGSSNNIEALDGIRFSSITTRALWIHAPSGGYTVTYSGHIFDFAAGTAVTVRFTSPDTTTARTITMLDAQHPAGTAGAANGEANDQDSEPSTYAKVTWVNPIFWQYAGGSTAWDVADNWKFSDGSPAAVPTLGDAVKIDNAPPAPLAAQSTFPTIPNGVAALAGSVEIRGTASLTMATGAPQATLQVKGAFTKAAGATFAAGEGKVIFGEGNATDVGQTVPPLTFYDVEIRNINQAEVVPGGAIIINGTLTVQNGAAFKSAADVNIRKDIVLNGTGTLSPQSGSRFIFDGSTLQTLTSDQFSKTFAFLDVRLTNTAGVTISTSGTSTLTVRTLTLDLGGVLTMSSHSYIVSGDLEVLGTSSISPGTSTLTMRNAATAQNIRVSTDGKIVDLYKLVVESKTAGGGLAVVNTAAGAVTTTLRIASDLAIGSGTNLDSTLDYSGGADDTVKIELKGNWTKSAAASAVTSTRSEVIVNGNASQNISASSFNILRINRTTEIAGTKAAFSGNISARQLIHQAGTLDFGSALSHSIAYDLTAAGKAVDLQSGTVTLAGTTLTVTSNRDGALAADVYLHVQSGCHLKLQSGAVIKIGQLAGGTNPRILVNGELTSEGATPPLIDDASTTVTPDWGIELNGATIHINGLELKNYGLSAAPGKVGMVINNPASFSNANGSPRLDKLLFRGNATNPADADLYVTGWTVAMQVEFHSCNYESVTNISDSGDTLTSTVPKKTITNFQATGSTGSSANENDPGNDGIFWISTKIWSGAENASWTDPDNWSPQPAPNADSAVIIPDIADDGDPATIPHDLFNVNAYPARCRSLEVTYNSANGDGGKINFDTNNRELHCLGDFTIRDGGLVRVGYTELASIADNNNYLLVQGNWSDQTIYGGGNSNIMQGPAGNDANVAYSTPPFSWTKGLQQYNSSTPTRARIWMTGAGKKIFGSTTFANLAIGGPQPVADANVNSSGWDISLGDAADIKIGHPNASSTNPARFVVKLAARFRGGTNTTPAKMTFYNNAQWTHETGAGNLDWEPGNSLVIWLNADGNTGTAGNQLPNNRPTAGESYFYDLQIGDGTTAVTVTLDRPLRVLRNLTIKRNATLNVGTNALIVGGNLTVEGQLGATPAGTISFGAGQGTTFGTDTAALPPAATTWQVTVPDDNGDGIPNFNFQDVTVNDLTATVGTLELLSNMMIAGSFTTNENVKLNSNTIRFAGTSAAQTITVTGGTLIQDTGTFYLDQAATVTDQPIPYCTFYNLTVSGGNTYFLDCDVTVQNDLTLSAGTLDVRDSTGTPDWNLTIQGNFTMSGGTLQPRVGSASEIRFTLGGTKSVAKNSAGALPFNILVVSKTGGTLNYSSSTGASFTAQTLNMTAGTFNLGSGFSHSVSGTGTISGGTLRTVTSNISFGTLTISGGTADLTDVSDSTTDTDITISGAFTLSSGVLDMSGAATPIVEVQGDWTHSGGSFNVGTGTVRLTGAAANIDTQQEVPNQPDFYNLTIEAAAAKSAVDTVLISNHLRINSGTFDAASQTVIVNGNILKDALVGTATLQIGASPGLVDANGDINATSGALNVTFTGNGRLHFGGVTFTLNGGSLTPSTGTVRFDNTSAGQTVPGFSYYNLEIANGGQTAMASTGASVGGSLFVGVSGASAGRFSLGSVSLVVTGVLSVENGGTLNLNTGTLTVSGAVSGTGSGNTINFNNGILDANGSFNSTNITLNFNFAGTSGVLRLGSGTPTFGTVNSTTNGTIRFDDTTAGVQNVPVGITYYILEAARGAGGALGTSGAGTLNVLNTLRLVDGTFTPGNNIDTVAVDLVAGTLNLGTLSVTVSGNWTNSGATLSAGTSSVTFDGTSQTGSITGGSNTFFNVQVGTASASTTLTWTAGSFNADGSVTIEAVSAADRSTLDLGAATHTVGGTTSVEGILDLEGSGATYCEYVAKSNLTVQATGQISLRNLGRLRAGGTGVGDPAITVDIQGTLFTPSGTSTKPEIVNGTQRFNFFITGTCNVSGLVFSGAKSDATSRGFEIRSGATVSTLNNVTFLNVQKPGVHLNLLVTAGMADGSTLTISQCRFDTSYHPDSPDPGSVASDPQVPDFATTASNAIVAAADTAANKVTIIMSSCKWNDTGINISPTSGNQQDFDYSDGSETDLESDTATGTGRVVVRWKRAYEWTGGGANAKWSNTLNWASGEVPPTTVAGDVRDIIIPAGTPQDPALDQNAVGISLTVENGKRVTVDTTDAGTVYTLTLQGDLSLLDTTAGDAITGGLDQATETIHLVFDSGSAQSITRQNTDVTFAVTNVTVTVSGLDNNRTVLINNSLTIGGALTIAEDTLKIAASQTVTVGGNAVVESGGILNLSETGSRLNVNGSIDNQLGGTITFGAAGTGTLQAAGSSFTSSGTFTAGNGEVEFTGPDKTVPALTYWNLETVTSGTFTLAGAIAVQNLTIGAGTTLSVSASNYQINVRGNFTRNGTFTPVSGTVVFDGSSAQSIGGGATTFFNVTIDHSGTGVSTSVALTIGGKLLVNKGKLDLGASLIHSVTGTAVDAVKVDAVGGTGTLDLNTSRLNVSGGVQIQSGATVDMTSEHPVETIELDVSGAVSISGTLDLSGSPAVIRVAGNWTANAGSTINLTSSSSKVIFAKSAAGDQLVTVQNAAGGDFRNIQIGVPAGAAPAVRLTGNTRVAGNVVFENGTLGKETAAAALTLRVAGNWTDNNGGSDNFVEGSVTVRFDGSSPQSVSAETFETVEIDSTSTVTAAGRLVMTTLTFVRGTLDLGSAITSPTHNVTGNASISPASGLSATLEMNTSALTVGGNVTIGTGAGTGTLNITFNSSAATDLLVTGDLTIGANGTLNGTGSTASIQVAGNWSDSGTFNIGNTTVTLSGAVKTISAANAQDFYHLTISGAITATTNLDIDGNVSVEDGGTFTLQNATALTHDVAGTVTVKGGTTGGKLDLKSSTLRMSTSQGAVTLTFHVQSGTVRGELVMDDGSQLLFANNHRMLVEGKITCDADASAADAAEPKITRLNVGDRYEIELKGAISISGLSISYYNSNGLMITGTDGASNSISGITFNDVDFRNAVSGGVHLKLGAALTGTRTMNFCSFDSTFGLGSGANVQQLASSTAQVTFTQFGNAGGEGEEYDLEWNVSNNNIKWSRTLYWVGEVSNDWFTAGNWSFTSGGAGGAGVPTQDDIAIIDDVHEPSGLFNAVINNTTATAFALILRIKQDDPAKAGQGGDLTVNTNLSISDNLIIEGTTSANTGFLHLNIADAAKSMDVKGNILADGGGLDVTDGLIKLNGGKAEIGPQEILSSITVKKLQVDSWVKLAGSVQVTTTATTDALVVNNTWGLILHKTAAASAPGLKFAAGGQARIHGSFKALTDFGTTAPRPLITRSGGAGTIDFNLGGSADPVDIVDVRSLDFSYGDAEGLNIVANSATVWSSFDGVAFANASTRHLTITAHGGRVDSPNTTFDATGTVNVRVDDPAPAPDRFTIVLVTSNDAAAAPGKGEGRDEDLNTGSATWVEGITTVTTNPGSESNTPERKGLQGGLLIGLDSKYGYGLVGQGSASAPADDRFVVIDTDPASPNFRNIVASQTFDRTIYGEIVGRALVLPVDTNDDDTPDADDIIFGTTTGRVVRLRYNGTTLSTMNDVVVPGLSTITGPLVSDLTWKEWPWGTTDQSTSNIFFAGLDGTTPKFYGVQYTSPGTPIAGFPVTLAAASYGEPTISVLNVSGLGTDEYIFFATVADAGGVSHFYRIKATGGLDLHEYSGASGPDSDAINPVWESDGVLGSGTTIQRRRTNTTTSAAVSTGATSISVASTSGFPASGTLLVEDDVVTYTGTTATSFTGVSGVDVDHPADAPVYVSAGTARAYLMSSTSGGGLAASAGWPVAATGTGNTGIETGISQYAAAPVVWGQNNGIVHARNMDGTTMAGFPLTVDSGARFTTFPQAPVTLNEHYIGTTSGRVWKITISPAGSTLMLELGPGAIITNIQPTFTHLVIGTQGGRVYFIPYP